MEAAKRAKCGRLMGTRDSPSQTAAWAVYGMMNSPGVVLTISLVLAREARCEGGGGLEGY